MHSYFIELFDHYYPGDHWVYDFYYWIPFYSPVGEYTAKIVAKGYPVPYDQEFRKVEQSDLDKQRELIAEIEEFYQWLSPLKEDELASRDWEGINRVRDIIFASLPDKKRDPIVDREYALGCAKMHFTVDK